MINATTLTGRVLRDDKIILFISLSVICLSFTILNNFENKKGVIKVLVYSFVNNYNWRLGAISVGCFTRFDQIITDVH